MDFAGKNSIGPLFVALADHCVQRPDGVLTMINPTIALSAPSGLNERRTLAERYHIHTVLTGRWPREFTLSQNVEVDECIVIAVRHDGNRPPTRFVHLDRMPHDAEEVAELHQALQDATLGLLADGWGEVSTWPAERIADGDWTPAIWRSSELAEASRRFADTPKDANHSRTRLLMRSNPRHDEKDQLHPSRIRYSRKFSNHRF